MSPLVSSHPWTSLSPPLSDAMLSSLARNGFSGATKVQVSTIPHFLSHKDVVVEAVTGTGKTLAFLVPAIEILNRRSERLSPRQVGALIIAPTRELAKQIYLVVQSLLTHFSGNYLHSHLFVGLDKTNKDIQKVGSSGGCNVIVGTPGRILSMMLQNEYKLDMRELDVLVLDEADRLLDLGFKETLQQIFVKCPKQRRTALFSATMSDELSRLVGVGLRNPIKIVVKLQNLEATQTRRIPLDLSVHFVTIQPDKKLTHLVDFLSRSTSKTIVYFSTCFCVKYFSVVIPEFGQVRHREFYGLHGKIEPKRRVRIFDRFSNSDTGVLLCTDVAARGLDIQNVDWVIQFDLPQDPKSFIHRCGRTARLGGTGKALFYIDGSEISYLDLLTVQKVPFTPLELDTSDLGLEQQLLAKNAQDPELSKKAVRAFVSHIRFYTEHGAKFIFNLKNLDLRSVSRLFGLPRIPAMSETRVKKKMIRHCPNKARL